VTGEIVGNSPTLVVGGGLEQLKKWRSLSPLGLTFEVQQGFLLVGPMAPGMGQQEDKAIHTNSSFRWYC
jgi:hypothetical protein